MKILFMLSGSIACFKACEVVSQLVQKGHEIQCVVSDSALNFVGAATLEGLTGKPVLQNMFSNEQKMAHISLDRWADVAIVCPATANTINMLAAGITKNSIGAIFLAWELNKKPFLVAPAMNSRMFLHPATVESIAKLESWGVEIIPPAEGSLACGETGVGRLAEIETVINKINSL